MTNVLQHSAVNATEVRPKILCRFSQPSLLQKIPFHNLSWNSFATNVFQIISVLVLKMEKWFLDDDIKNHTNRNSRTYSEKLLQNDIKICQYFSEQRLFELGRFCGSPCSDCACMWRQIDVCYITELCSVDVHTSTCWRLYSPSRIIQTLIFIRSTSRQCSCQASDCTSWIDRQDDAVPSCRHVLQHSTAWWHRSFSLPLC